YANNTGIYVSYGGTVQNNYVGTLDGNSPSANVTGIEVFASATISNNVISGNSGNGIEVFDQGGTTIQGNYIGTNASGNAPLSNAGHGIHFNYSYGGAQISGNTIAANASSGISMNSANGITTIGSNMIGVSGDGMAGLGNATGIEADCSSGIYISSNNVISGNSWEGVYFSGVSNSRIWINKIGVASDAASPIANDSGVILETSYCGDFLTASTGVDIYGNVIAMNNADGVAISSSGDPLIMNVGNPISENSIYGNGHKNISLDVYGGPLANDDMDGDTGPNNWQNYPVITSIGQGAGQTTVNYTLNSTPAGNFRVEFFDNSAGGAPAAEQYLGNSSPPATDVSGNTSGSVTFSGLHDFISATATNTLTHDTSEISAIFSLIPVPAVNVSRSTIDFGNIPTGGASATQSVTLTSTGNVPYRITSLTSSPSCYGGPICSTGDSGDFMCSTGTCATSTDYAPGSSCSFSGTFAPNTLGAKSTTFYVCDNASGSPRAFTFSGTGIVPPPITISPASFNFGSVLVGQSGVPQTFTIANPGSVPLTIGPVTTTSNFSVVLTDCGSAIPPRSSCIAQVAFTPTQAGSLSGLVSVAVGAGPAASASLSGTGTQAAALTLPSAIDLGSFLVGSTTPLSVPVELRNSGNAVLTLGNITLTGPFTLANPCPINLAPGASCTLTLGFSTTTRGEFNGTLTVLSNASGGSRVIPVTARSQLVAAPVIKVTPSFIGFGDRLAGAPSAPQRVTVTNEGGVDAVLGPITTDVDFLVVSTTCGLTLAASSTCFADVALRPVGFGPRVGVLRVPSNAAGSPNVVNLLGTGCRPFLFTSNRLGTRSNCSP
ncbi:MAG: choice-of-anchor D domain-containing protein, partial [Usitatibacter sp.]